MPDQPAKDISADVGASKERDTAPPGSTRLDRAKKKDRGPDLSGTALGDFLLLRKLGSGGMGEVYLARQLSLKRQVALKLLRSDLSASETALKRFAVEAEAAAKLTHANIVQIYAFGQQDGTSFMALEYVQGMNLREFVAKKGPVNARFAVRVMEQVAAALHHAAEAGVVHRDVKPDNILLTRKGEVKVADFGLARLRAEAPVSLTQTGVTMGTPLYMSPEQVQGNALDARSDLYSFGVTCYFMLTGQPPFRGETALAVALEHMNREPQPLAQIRPDLPAELCRIVHKLMAKKPDQRYQTGRQVSRDLEKLRAELPAAEPAGQTAALIALPETPTRPVLAEPGSRLSRIFRIETMRRNWVWWLAASLLLGSSGGAGYGWYQRAPDLRPRSGDVPKGPPPIPWEQVPQQPTAQAQYDYALAVGQFNNAEAAWTAVFNYHQTEPEWAYRAKMQLGRHYLEERQLEKAEKHFAEMAGDPDRRSQLASDVGRAAVLSLRDRPQESLDVLWNVVQSGQVGNDRALIGLILWTLERDYRNLGQDSESNREVHRRISQMLWRPGQQATPPGSDR
jgi:serine/threonine-protein kinase